LCRVITIKKYNEESFKNFWMIEVEGESVYIEDFINEKFQIEEINFQALDI
jgi:hypothetical protein